MSKRLQINLRFDNEPELHEAVKNKAAELGTSINAFMLAAAKSALGWQAPIDSVKMLKLIGNLESRVHQLEQELKKLRQN
ncbi:hypothetical protein H1P_1700001 [Hyella patelloides LEGE 07179]|uniref:Toxin-antitoxin system HicB family antitoxin n=1 Tax=Hyella patelloides LEGE 07179 TaxID=945734 RepID=A0A563VN54_9CYAN|nr:hypothetical protein [Hyella patelloides]VEP12886.1 hypothetical protein H1P_1700001 [Hyella patelloides LEGE 07179]